jgi:hypothetical protein
LTYFVHHLDANSGAQEAWIAIGPSELRLSRALVYSETMFARRLSIHRIDSAGERHACPIRHIDSFAMRNFTNDAVFDDTFPAADGLLEAGSRVPLDRLQSAMEDWFRRKGYLKPGERLEVLEIDQLA